MKTGMLGTKIKSGGTTVRVKVTKPKGGLNKPGRR